VSELLAVMVQALLGAGIVLLLWLWGISLVERIFDR
jgi:hypothetical protein